MLLKLFYHQPKASSSYIANSFEISQFLLSPVKIMRDVGDKYIYTYLLIIIIYVTNRQVKYSATFHTSINPLKMISR